MAPGTSGTATVQWLPAAGGTQLALHRWETPRDRAAVFYAHGIQSHAGWLEETAAALGTAGVSLFALDRRGSGRSDGARGHLAHAQVVIDDYLLALYEVRAAAGDRPLLALGQSLGGSILAAMWVEAVLPVDALVFCAPALGQQRRRHGAEALAALRRLHGPAMTPVSLRDEDYTDDPERVRFMRDDPLMLREVTEQTRATLVEIEDRYAEAPPPAWSAGLPVALAVPRADHIIDLDAARAVLRRLAPGFTEGEFATDRHYIEFTPARLAYWSWLAKTALAAGAR